MILEKFTIGVGDRFAHQAKAQLQACINVSKDGADVVPVWNKSNREHTFIGSEPASVKAAAVAAVAALDWKKGWHVDADHIRIETVDRFLDASDFFTIDVADSIGQAAEAADVFAFLERHPELVGTVSIAGIDAPFVTTREDIGRVATKYLRAVQDAGRIYRHIAVRKGGDENFIAEVSMDETDSPQTPPELLVILVALADEGVKAQTIAPKFTGRFNKGVDYVGDLAQFEKEFNDDLAVIAHAVAKYGLPANLKLSVHSGSDKYSLYPIIRRALARTGAGVHLKTAGTTWLEEIIGLSEAGGDGLALAKEIYAYALEHVDELCAPYASVIDIDRSKLPSAEVVNGWTGAQLASAVRHIPGHPEFNANIRQLLHVSFKLAAKAGTRYTDLLKANEAIVAKNVIENLYDRHLRPAVRGMIWETRNHTFDFARRGVVMGILNVTPDSFSDGGHWLDVDAAVAHARRMIAEGAEILDIGGESTRPGATPVDEAEELRRVIPVIEKIAALPEKCTISVDTMKPGVARAACAVGAGIINDVGGLRDDAMLAAVAETGAGVVAMHMQGVPQTMQSAPVYENVSNDVKDFFCQTMARAVRSGVPAARLVFDPGIGFGKTLEHNLELLRRLPELCAAASQRPVLLGVSRKSFIGKVIGSSTMEDRSWPTVALTGYGREKGARIFRVHEVRPNVEALRMTEAILG